MINGGLYLGKSSVNGPFSIAMLNNQRVICLNCVLLYILGQVKN